MIAIISDAPRERAALEALCEERNWQVSTCDSVRSFRRLLARATPQVVLTRGRLADGHGDKVLPLAPPEARKVVLLAAGTPPADEARIVLLGADCVLRDPVRINVLCEYLAKYMTAVAHQPSRFTAQKTFCFAGMNVDVMKRQIYGNDGLVLLTPREIALAQLLVEADGDLVPYELLYKEVLGRKFDGDTSNMRVLLGRLNTSGENAGADMRRWIHVIPKTGYRYYDKGKPSKPRAPKPTKASAAAVIETPSNGIPASTEVTFVEDVTEKLR